MEDKFKVGDKVRCIDSTGKLILGHIYAISYAEQNFVGVDGRMYGDWYQNRFELITSTTTFKTGDKAKLIKMCDSVEGFKLGEIVTIYNPKNYGDYTIEISHNSGLGMGFVNEEHLELITETPLGRGIRIHKVIEEVSRDYIKNEETKMELKDIKKPNLDKATDKFNEDQMNAEVKFALEELKSATDEVDRLDREIKMREEQKNPYLEIIKKISGKK